MRAVLAAGLLTSACSVKLAFDGTSYACPSGDCPPGYQCLAGECVPGAGTPDAPVGPPSDGLPNDAVAPTHCNSVLLVADDFEDGVVFVEPWISSYEDGRTSLSESGGRAVIDLADDANGDHFAGYLSTDLYDLRDSRVTVEVVEAAPPTNASVTYVTAEHPSNDSIEMRVFGDTLEMRHLIDGNETVVDQIPYDPVAHRFWALREAGGTSYWETSPDGSSFTARAQAATPFDVAWVRLHFGAGTWDNVLDAGRAVFDSYNGGVPAGSRCAASSLVDDFDDGTVARVWTRSYLSASCTRQETGGELVITPSDTLTGFCGYQSGARFDLDGDAATVEVTSVLAGAGQTIFSAVDRTGAYVQMLSEGSMLIPRRVPADGSYVDLPAVPYDPVAHRFWRLRQEGTTTYWEASPDGANWTTIGSIEGFLDPSAVRLDLGAGTWTPTPTPGVARFARLGAP